VLVEILQGEIDMLVPMFQSRGLPIHPGVLENTKVANLDYMKKLPKLTVKDYIGTNRVLSSSPPWSLTEICHLRHTLIHLTIYPGYIYFLLKSKQLLLCDNYII